MGGSRQGRFHPFIFLGVMAFLLLQKPPVTGKLWAIANLTTRSHANFADLFHQTLLKREFTK